MWYLGSWMPSMSSDITWWWKGQKKVRRLMYRVKDVRRLMWHLCSPSKASIPLPHTAVNNISSNQHKYGHIHIHSYKLEVLRICTLTEFHSCQILFRSTRTNILWWGHRRPVVRAIGVSHAACIWWVSTKSSISPQMAFFHFIVMFKVSTSKYDSSQQELLLSCCFFDHVSSNMKNLWLLPLFYRRVLFHQLASPPGFLVTHIPKGNLVYLYSMI